MGRAGILQTDMGQDSTKAPLAKSDSREDNTFVILQTIGDTTWRMFVPSIGFTLLGVWLDSIWGTKPWAMVVGIALGCLGAYALVAKQLKTIKRSRK